MNSNREFQKQVLEAAIDSYPGDIDIYTIKGLPSYTANVDIDATLAYLAEHGLLVLKFQEMPSGARVYTAIRATASGIDFVADDGGLTAVLGVVTVRLHSDTIKDLILAKIEQSSAPEHEKSRLRSFLENLSEEGWKEVTGALVKRAIDSAPDIIDWAQVAFKAIGF